MREFVFPKGASAYYPVVTSQLGKSRGWQRFNGSTNSIHNTMEWLFLMCKAAREPFHVAVRFNFNILISFGL